MTDKKKPECSCFLCSLPPWMMRLLLVLPFAGIALGAAGIFTDVGSPDTPRNEATIIVGVPTLNGRWVTFTPEPTETPVPTPTVPVAARQPVIREIVQLPPVVAVITVLVAGSHMTPTPSPSVVASAVPTAPVILPSPTPCDPPFGRASGFVCLRPKR